MTVAPDEPLMTRRPLADWLTKQGFPISYSTITKYCSPAINCGPPVEAYWGRLPMHRPSTALEWARARLRPAKAPVAQRESASRDRSTRRAEQQAVSNTV